MIKFRRNKRVERSRILIKTETVVFRLRLFRTANQTGKNYYVILERRHSTNGFPAGDCTVIFGDVRENGPRAEREREKRDRDISVVRDGLFCLIEKTNILKYSSLENEATGKRNNR